MFIKNEELVQRIIEQIHDKKLQDNRYLLYQDNFPQLSSRNINNNTSSYNIMTFQTFNKNQMNEFNSETFFQNLINETTSAFKSQ